MVIITPGEHSEIGREAITHLNYEFRKKDFLTDESEHKIIERQKKDLDIILRELNNENLSVIEDTLVKLDLFCDICNYSYISILKVFEEISRRGAGVTAR